MQQGKVFSAALFCCRGRIEIKYLLTWLLQNNLFGVEMFFEFQTPFLHLEGYSATNTILNQRVCFSIGNEKLGGLFQTYVIKLILKNQLAISISAQLLLIYDYMQYILKTCKHKLRLVQSD